MPGGTTAKHTTENLLRRLSRAGFVRGFVREAVLPDWWDDSCLGKPSLLPDVEIRVARFLHVPLDVVRDPSQRLEPPSYPNARLRKVKNIDADRVGPAIHAGLSLASAALRSLRQSLPSIALPPTDSSEWRRLLLQAKKIVDLETIATDLWRRGIPVLHVDVSPSPRFQGLACIVDGRPVVLVGHDIDTPARLLSHIAHEAAHIVRGDCEEGAPVVDEDDLVSDRDEMERAADHFALVVALSPDKLPSPPEGDFKAVAAAASKLARERAIDSGSIVWSWAPRLDDYATAQLALKALYKHAGGARTLRQLFEKHVDVEGASDSDRALLRCVKGDLERNAAAG